MPFYRFEHFAKDFARYAMVQSTAWLENKIETMTPAEQARARVQRRAN